MKKINKSFDLVSFIIGGMLATWLCIIVYAVGLSGKTTTDTVGKDSESVTESTTESTTTTSYNTSIESWKMTLDSGEKVKYTTPSGYYSLSDQYLENLASYYKVDKLNADSLVVLGDATTPYESKTVLNADKLSDVSNILKQVYGKDYKAEDVIESEAYTYMKTGKIPDNAPTNYEIEEVKTYDVDGITYKAYEVNYDTTYEASTEPSTEAVPSTEAATGTESQVVHTHQICCYSNTKDAVEIIIYQQTFDKDAALNMLSDFLGVK